MFYYGRKDIIISWSVPASILLQMHVKHHMSISRKSCNKTTTILLLANCVYSMLEVSPLCSDLVCIRVKTIENLLCMHVCVCYSDGIIIMEPLFALKKKIGIFM